MKGKGRVLFVVLDRYELAGGTASQKAELVRNFERAYCALTDQLTPFQERGPSSMTV